MNQNKIEKAAIKYKGIVYSLPRPNRHHNIIYDLVYVKGFTPPCSGEQGFIDTMGSFLTRKEALSIAQSAKQIKNGKIIGGELTSEDLW